MPIWSSALVCSFALIGTSAAMGADAPPERACPFASSAAAECPSPSFELRADQQRENEKSDPTPSTHKRIRGTPRYTIVDVGTLGGTQTQGTAMNASGQVAGYSETTMGDFHAFFFDPVIGKIQDLDTLG